MDVVEFPVKRGAWLYDGTVRSEVIVVRRDLWFGTGDYEDEAVTRDDAARETFEVRYAVAADPSRFAGGGQYETLAEALGAARSACGESLRWEPDHYFSRNELERSAEPAALCKVLEALIQNRLAAAGDRAHEALSVANDLRSSGHDLWSWDESHDFSIWGDDYANPRLPTRFLLEMRWPSPDSSIGQPEVEISFGPWPRR